MYIIHLYLYSPMCPICEQKEQTNCGNQFLVLGEECHWQMSHILGCRERACGQFGEFCMGACACTIACIGFDWYPGSWQSFANVYLEAL